MEIKIDTTKDSPEHIQHMIDFLTRFVAVQMRQSTSTPTDTPSPSEGLFGMFGQEPNNTPSPEPEDEKPQSFSLEPY